MKTSDFNYNLPEKLIARYPLPERAASRLLVLHRDSGDVEHRSFSDVPDLLVPGDLLLLNDTRVIPARLLGRKKQTGGKVEALVIRKVADEGERELWQCIIKSSKGLKQGGVLVFGDAKDNGNGNLEAHAVEKDENGLWTLLFSPGDVLERVKAIGEIPIPPYLNRRAEDIDTLRYQTVFARRDGAVAAPTAGLHFDESMLSGIKKKGVDVRHVTLHTGPATFMPVRVDDVTDHTVPEEFYSIGPEVADLIVKAKQENRRVVAVGTTVTRAVESAFKAGVAEEPVLEGGTSLTIFPGYEFNVISALITNFHLPCSTLLMLVSAFAGREVVLSAYEQAVEREYRFFSYCDCMILL